MAAPSQLHFKVASLILLFFFSLGEEKSSSLEKEAIYMLAVSECYVSPPLTSEVIGQQSKQPVSQSQVEFHILRKALII